jgi:Galactose binding lectin domain
MVAASATSTTDVMTQESCQADMFTATCEDGHVIIMQSALYGRMKQGRCVKGDYGHLGCSRNALPYMEAECSGRRECRFRVFDSPLRDQSPCPEDMASYLESSYTCLNGMHVGAGIYMHVCSKQYGKTHD